MVKDNNKGIDTVIYNHLNLPAYVEMSDGSAVQYIYAADGTKLRKCEYLSNETIPSKTNDYIDGFVYIKDDDSNKLDYFSMPEGRVTHNSTNYQYEYAFTDQVGNTRLMFTDSANIAIVLQENHYDPFGMQLEGLEITGDNKSNILYNSKELQDKMQWYSFGWRELDPQLGVWHAIDPEAEKYYSLSPYNYVFNNPINVVDPDGRDPIDDESSYCTRSGGAILPVRDGPGGGSPRDYGSGGYAGIGISTQRWLNLDQMINYAWDNTVGSRTFYFGGNSWSVSKSFDTGEVLNTKNLLFEGSQHPTATGQFFGKLLAGFFGGEYSYSSYYGYGFYNISYSVGNSYLGSAFSGDNFTNSYIHNVFSRLLNDNSQSSNGGSTPWMTAATDQLGIKEIAGSKHNPSIIGYHATTGGFKDDETPWCSSFVNWAIIQASIKGTNSARALSWNGWGQSLNTPAYGSIAIINYGKGKGHVGFVVGVNSSGSIILLGGNQSNMVKYSAFSPSSISGYVYPLGYTPSYVLPTLEINKIESFNSTR